MESQMLKGLLEGCLLTLLAEEEVYGYELSEKLHQAGLTMVKEGSIYPLLLRMQKNGLIEGRLRESATGPNRKYYRLTAAGQEALLTFDQHWTQLAAAITHLRRNRHEDPTTDRSQQ